MCGESIGVYLENMLCTTLHGKQY